MKPPTGHEEQDLPSYLRRRDVHVLLEFGRGVCGCPFLEQTYGPMEYLDGASWAGFRCVDCGAVWEQKT